MFFFLLSEIRRGKSLARALLNAEVRNHRIQGRILDVGGGKHCDYFRFLQGGGQAAVETVDLQPQQAGAIALDLERDPLPATENSFDTVIVFNLLEHIYNHQFLTQEMHRVLKMDGTLIGFVPFLVNYHPDPHDYFRYTKEALRELFTRAGFGQIEIKEIGRGPFAVNYNNTILSFPIAVRVILFPFMYALDSLFLRLRPAISHRYPLGYFFVLQKDR